MLGLTSSIAEQAEWLQRIDPGYVLAYPSLLAAVAEELDTDDSALPRLREVRCFGELLDGAKRRRFNERWNVPVSDIYSCEEVGYIALQCPEYGHYHVQAENVLVEVLREDGSSCEPGEIGRVVLTSLNNFAMPLIRYEILDFAEIGPPCPCGRGLPVLKRILGRQRNILTLPSGERRWPTFAEGERPENLPPLFQFQIVQKTLRELEARVVRPSPFTPEEEHQMRAYLTRSLGHAFDVRFTYLDEIPRNPNGKYEDFRSELEPISTLPMA